MQSERNQLVLEGELSVERDGRMAITSPVGTIYRDGLADLIADHLNAKRGEYGHLLEQQLNRVCITVETLTVAHAEA